jgi:hypothetical protein
MVGTMNAAMHNHVAVLRVGQVLNASLKVLMVCRQWLFALNAGVSEEH